MEMSESYTKNKISEVMYRGYFAKRKIEGTYFTSEGFLYPDANLLTKTENLFYPKATY